MSVEAREEAAMASLNSGGGGGKRRRTKRKRLLQLPQPAIAAAASSTSSSGFSVGATVEEEEEEEDMANCLILLARGRSADDEIGGGGGSERIVTSHRVAEEAPAAADGKAAAGFYVYECKTCSKCFPSFQALGGHRAGHKKPKTTAPAPAAAAAALAADERKASRQDVTFARFYPRPRIPPVNVNDATVTSGAGVAPMLAVFNSGGTVAGGNKPRVHECSICGSEFSSGQALGGHMRRHRAAAAAAATIITEPQGVTRAEKHILSLDLNLPAPPDADDDLAELPKPASFSFSAKQNLILSASPLVDCHY